MQMYPSHYEPLTPLDFIRRIFRPSISSSVVCVLAGVGCLLSVLLRLSPLETTLKTSFSGIINIAAFTSTAQSINNTTFSPSLVVGVFWAIVGFAVYLVVASIFSVLGNFLYLRKELRYVNAHPRALLLNAVADVMGHGLIFFGWVLYARVFFVTVLPHALSQTSTAVHGIVPVQQAESAVVAFMLVAAGVYGHILFMRLARYWRTDILHVRLAA